MPYVLNPVNYRVGHSALWDDFIFLDKNVYPTLIHTFINIRMLILYIFSEKMFQGSSLYLNYVKITLFSNKLFISIFFYDSVDIIFWRLRRVSWFFGRRLIRYNYHYSFRQFTKRAWFKLKLVKKRYAYLKLVSIRRLFLLLKFLGIDSETLTFGVIRKREKLFRNLSRKKTKYRTRIIHREFRIWVFLLRCLDDWSFYQWITNEDSIVYSKLRFLGFLMMNMKFKNIYFKWDLGKLHFSQNAFYKRWAIMRLFPNLWKIKGANRILQEYSFLSERGIKKLFKIKRSKWKEHKDKKVYLEAFVENSVINDSGDFSSVMGKYSDLHKSFRRNVKFFRSFWKKKKRIKVFLSYKVHNFWNKFTMWIKLRDQYFDLMFRSFDASILSGYKLGIKGCLFRDVYYFNRFFSKNNNSCIPKLNVYKQGQGVTLIENFKVFKYLRDFSLLVNNNFRLLARYIFFDRYIKSYVYRYRLPIKNPYGKKKELKRQKRLFYNIGGARRLMKRLVWVDKLRYHNIVRYSFVRLFFVIFLLKHFFLKNVKYRKRNFNRLALKDILLDLFYQLVRRPFFKQVGLLLTSTIYFLYGWNSIFKFFLVSSNELSAKFLAKHIGLCFGMGLLWKEVVLPVIRDLKMQLRWKVFSNDDELGLSRLNKVLKSYGFLNYYFLSKLNQINKNLNFIYLKKFLYNKDAFYFNMPRVFISYFFVNLYKLSSSFKRRLFRLPKVVHHFKEEYKKKFFRYFFKKVVAIRKLLLSVFAKREKMAHKLYKSRPKKRFFHATFEDYTTGFFAKKKIQRKYPYPSKDKLLNDIYCQFDFSYLLKWGVKYATKWELKRDKYLRRMFWRNFSRFIVNNMENFKYKFYTIKLGLRPGKDLFLYFRSKFLRRNSRKIFKIFLLKLRNINYLNYNLYYNLGQMNYNKGLVYLGDLFSYWYIPVIYYLRIFYLLYKFGRPRFRRGRRRKKLRKKAKKDKSIQTMIWNFFVPMNKLRVPLGVTFKCVYFYWNYLDTSLVTRHIRLLCFPEFVNGGVGYNLGSVQTNKSALANQMLRLKKWNRFNYLYGFKLRFSGRFKRRSRRSLVWYRCGTVALGTKDAVVDYGFYMIPLRFSAFSIRVWLHRSSWYSRFCRSF